ncbi:MAG: hypothetical protein JXR64_04000, partial [Spirochaetales bacterium]|nr:hypothetical protein [Spirochaetales bacterium]
DSELDVDKALNWFYTEYRFVFWGAELFVHYKLLDSDKFSFYGDFHYINFYFRSNEWIVGATVGLLWHLN